MVWTQIGIATAHNFDLKEPGSISTSLLFQKVLFDCYWNLRVEILAEDTKGLDYTPDREAYATATNEDARWYREHQISYSQTLEREKARIFRAWKAEFYEIAREFFERYRSACEAATAANELGGYDPTTLPSMQVLAGVNAALIVGTKRFKQNDMFDFNHAAVAVPYCDVLACDRAMAVLMTSKPLELHHQYGIPILSQPEELLEFLKNPQKKPSRD